MEIREQIEECEAQEEVDALEVTNEAQLEAWSAKAQAAFEAKDVPDPNPNPNHNPNPNPNPNSRPKMSRV